MTGFLSARQIRIFDYPRFAEPLRDRVRERAAELASAAGITIEHLAKKQIRKEDVVAKVLVVRGDRPGLVHIISAMEACDTYKPWHDKHTHRTFLRPDAGKCLHYYFYFMDAELGLIYLRVPTWCPFRLQFYCNGHSWLARQLTAAGVGFTLADNAFLRIDDWERAQALADTLSPDHLHRILDHYAQQCCPVLDVFAQSYHWSFMQVEYATDLVFRTPAILKPLYEQLSRQAILTVKAEHVATFLGHKITAQLAQEIDSQFTTRIEGTCVKHRFSKSSIKKFGLGDSAGCGAFTVSVAADAQSQVRIGLFAGGNRIRTAGPTSPKVSSGDQFGCRHENRSPKVRSRRRRLPGAPCYSYSGSRWDWGFESGTLGPPLLV